MAYQYGFYVEYHDQPPIDTPAKNWKYATSVNPDTTVAELIKLADNAGGIAYISTMELTINWVREDG